MGWTHGLSGRALASQIPGCKLNPQHHQKNTELAFLKKLWRKVDLSSILSFAMY
jgi:hypothetical protein